VTVTTATGTPTGQVEVDATAPDATIDSCAAPVTLSDGTGSCSITPASDTFGHITFVATYLGDTTHKGSTSADLTVDVLAPTTTTVTFDDTTDVLTANVENVTDNDISEPGGTGTVSFTTGAAGAAGTPIPGCTGLPLTFTATSGTGASATGTNTATCDYTPTADSTVTVYATYTGDGSNEGSNGSLPITTPGGGDD
jgi:hypothetical protein